MRAAAGKVEAAGGMEEARGDPEREERSVEDAENRLVDVQVCFLSHYDAHHLHTHIQEYMVATIPI